MTAPLNIAAVISPTLKPATAIHSSTASGFSWYFKNVKRLLPRSFVWCQGDQKPWTVINPILIDILPDRVALLRRDLRQQSLLDNIEFGLKDVEALPG